MPYTIGYPDDCEDVEHLHQCDDCEAQEGARVRSFFFVREDYEFLDPTSVSEWQQAYEDGNVIVIPKTNGTFDGGTPNYSTGYGDQLQRYINSTFKATYRDPNVKLNYDFYEGQKRSNRWKPGFRTESLVWIGDGIATVAPKAVVADDINAAVVWEVEVTWNSTSHPEPFDAPATIFDCITLTSE